MARFPESATAHRGWVIAAAAVLGAALVVVLFWPVADLIARHDVHIAAGAASQQRLAKARDDARGRVLQLLAGLLAVGAFVYTARNFALARNQAELNRRTLELAIRQADHQVEAGRLAMAQSEAVQITDRFARAIEQLASNAVDARLGAIYALERIAADSPRDHPVVIEVLAAFARRVSTTRTGADLPQDLQAAVTVIGRRDTAHDVAPVTLAHADLRGADLTALLLDAADLTGAQLTGARLDRVRLAAARLANADFGAARLAEADLRGADLTGAKLAAARLPAALLGGATLDGADLSHAGLTDASLREASATGATMHAADLRGADLTGARLGQADLTNAVLRDASLHGAAMRAARVGQADLTGADLAGADLTDVRFNDAGLRGADLRGATLRNAVFAGADLAGALLAGTDLAVVSLAGLDLTGALVEPGTWLPDGWQRDAAGRMLRR